MAAGQYYPLFVSIPPTAQDASKIITDTNLVAHWKLENVNDSWFNGLTLTNNGTAIFKKGKFGNCVFLDGIDDYLSRASTTVLDLGINDAEFFVLIRGIKGTGTKTIFDRFDGSSKGYKLEVNAATGILTFTIGADSTRTAASTTDVLDGKWHKIYIKIVRTANLEIHVDDRLAEGTGVLSTMTGLVNNTVSFRIGANQTPAQFFNGEVDDLRIYIGGVHTSAEIDSWFDLDDRYIVGAEERGGTLTLASQEQSKLSLEFAGNDKRWRRRYVAGSQFSVLHDVISMANIALLLNFEDTLDDESPYAHTITGINSPTYATGFYAGTKALSLASASSQRLEVIDVEQFDFGATKDLGIRFRFKTSGTTMYIIFKGREGANKRFFVQIDAAGKVKAEISDGTNTVSITSTAAKNDGAWHLGVILFDRDGNVTMDLDGASAATPVSISAVGNINNYEKLIIGAGLDSTGTPVNHLNGQLDGMFVYERVLTATEKTDANSSTTPSLACLLDGIIKNRPSKRRTSLPFTIDVQDYLFDRLSNDDLTLQFSGTTKVSDMLITTVARSILSSKFNTTNVTTIDISVEGKYFIREQLLDVFRWIADSGNCVFYSKKRGTNRYMFFHKKLATHSGIIIQPVNLLTDYGYGDDLYQTSNIIEVEGGMLKTIEEQQTFDNGTSKNSDTLYYAVKATPEFLEYGQFDIKLKKTGSPDDLHIELREDKAGNPAGPPALVLAAVEIPKDKVTTIMALVSVDFDVVLKGAHPSASTYWVVIFIEGDATNRYSFADNGGTVDTNMKTSSDDVSWAAVGYTFVYNFKRKDPVLVTVKDSTHVESYESRKLRFSDPTITDKTTARIIARGILERLGKTLLFIEDVEVKNLTGIPIPGHAVTLTDNIGTYNPGFNQDFEVQKVTVPLPRGHGGFFHKMTLDIGDKAQDSQKLFEQLVADLRRQIASDQQVFTDTRSWGENVKIGIRITGRQVIPFGGHQRIGFQITVDNAAQKFLAKTNMKWNDTTDADNVYGYGIWNP